MIRRSERLVLQRLLLAELGGDARERNEEAFTVRGIERGLPLSDRSVREALRRLARLRFVTGAPQSGVGTAAKSRRSRRTRNLYRLTPQGRDAALGRPSEPVPLALDFKMEFPFPAVVLRGFLIDPRRTGVEEPRVVCVGEDPPEYVVSMRGVPIFYRVASASGAHIACELSLGFGVPNGEPLWGRVLLSVTEADGRCMLRAERVEASANGAAAMTLLIQIGANLAANLLLRDMSAVLGGVRPVEG